jgi:hypothetical protein
MTYHPVASAKVRSAVARPTVGGRRAPVTARGRAVLDETRRRLSEVEPPVETARPSRLWA